MNRSGWLSALAVGVLLIALSGCASRTHDDLARNFAKPPESARPWVYWFWLDGNISREGITADLEAMKRVGVGGVLIMEVDQGTPKGSARIMSAPWRELFAHATREAQRLGLQINMNNDAGWCGSGGPWITPELSMQKLTFSETAVKGPMHFDGVLAKPAVVKDYYKDVAVLAVPDRGGRIKDIGDKAAFGSGKIAPQVKYPDTAPNSAANRAQIIDLTAKMQADGRLSWDAPEGNWVVMRIGRTSTGVENHPAPADALGLETDKLSKEATEAMFNGMMGKLIGDVGDLAGKSLVSTHIDSWETGSQNWTPKFREEFTRLRGYDPLLWLPAMNGRVVDSIEASERFLWDVRQTVSDLLVENYAGHLAELAHRHGMRLSIEAYDGPCDDMTYGGHCDEPMSEFWSYGYNTDFSCIEMASTAHTYGHPILGAEAFTATDAEKWQGHPGSIKAQGDWAFCQGVNRFVFHRYAMQPWIDRPPGISMGPWGLHYERTETWWEQSKAWHEYLARCQYLLQRGLFVADICFLEPEGSPGRFVPPESAGAINERARHNFDGCTPEVVMKRMSVGGDGRLMLPDGMSYRVLVLPEGRVMTPELLGKVMELVEAGATVIGAPPVKSPSLSDYPVCDMKVKRMTALMWGNCDGKTVTENKYGKGRVIWGQTPEQVLEEMNVPADFDYHTASGRRCVRSIHKQINGNDVYFVASASGNPEQVICSFRVKGKQAEFWWPASGRIERPAVWDVDKDAQRVAISLEANESVFVVFGPGGKSDDGGRIVACARDGKTIQDTSWSWGKTSGATDNNRNVTQSFTMAGWVRPTSDMALPQQVASGASGLNAVRNELLYPPPGHEVYGSGHAGSGISVGRNGVCVYEHSADYFAPVLVYGGAIKDWTYLAVVYRDGVPSLYLDGKKVATGLKGPFIVHPGAGVDHHRSVAPFKGQATTLTMTPRALSPGEIEEQMHATADERNVDASPLANVVRTDDGYEISARQSGHYELKMANGSAKQFNVQMLPAPMDLSSNWSVAFQPNRGAPASATFDKLISFSASRDPGVRYFSGVATYHKTLDVSSSLITDNHRLLLDLGQVEVMADVELNGQNLGTLWKAPYAVDITRAVHPGENDLRIKVADLWINRMIGDEHLPEDSDRNPNGTLKSWPKWVIDNQKSPTGRYTFTSWKLWSKDSPLVESGLIGPVQIKVEEQIHLAD